MSDLPDSDISSPNDNMLPQEAAAPAQGDYRRRRTRQAAVQLLYAIEMQEGRRAYPHMREDVIAFCAEESQLPPAKALDAEFLDTLIAGVRDHHAELDVLIAKYLSERWKFSRIDIIMRDILRLGVFELSMLPDITVATIINEYIEIARGYFEESEISFVNALLDNVAGAVREKKADE